MPSRLEGKGAVVGKTAPNFVLPDEQGKVVDFYQALTTGPALLVFYPKDFTLVCTKQLCNYSDNMSAFSELGIQIFGISQNTASNHTKFSERYNFPFSLLADEGHKTALTYGCTSLFTFGGTTRAVFIVSAKKVILYRYIEPTILTRRSADELLLILEDLKKHKLI